VSKRGSTNPYVAGPPIRGEEGFYGRHDLVEDVVTTLANTKQNAVVLHGQRRIGKSSLLYRLRRDKVLQQGHLPIFLDMQFYEGFSTARVLAHIAEAISDELNVSLPLPTDKELAADHNRFHRSFLPEVYGKLDQKRVLLLIDEFDVVVPLAIADSVSADTLPGYFRTLIAEEHEHLAFVFVVGQRLDLLGEGYQRLFKGAHARPVSRLDQEEAYELLTEVGQQGQVSYSEKALAEIWSMTNGHPYLTQLMGFEIFDRLQKQETQQASVKDVAACLDRAMQRGQGALDWFWRGFAPEQQWVLSAVADMTDRQKSVSGAEIDKSLQQHLLFLTPSAREIACRDLHQGDFLVETAERHYMFAVEFIRRWIVKRHPIKEIQRQIEEISPEALNYYQLGLHAFSRGNLGEAIEYYKQALDRNPHFARVHLELAVALRAQGKVPEAIAEYEKAYEQDPESARDGLIDLRMVYASQIENSDDQEESLAQAWRILEIDPEHADARRLVSHIYLDRVTTCLADNDFAQALSLVKQLAEPVPIIQQASVGQRVQELWLAYSHELTELKQPKWDEAQIVLDSLEPLGLMDDRARADYNQVTLDKAQSFLEKKDLEPALATLQNELKLPLPTSHIKAMLLNYSQRQAGEEHWTEAEKTFEGLCQIVDGRDVQTARLEFYHQWGDSLLAAGDFEGAIAVYRRNKAKEFKPKITKAYLLDAAWHLERHELPDAESSYKLALATQKNKAVVGQASKELVSYFHSRREDQAWKQASDVLEILRTLNLAEDDIPTLETRLHLDQAEAELTQGHLDTTFRHLAMLGDGAEAETKALVRVHLPRNARRGEWAAGAATVKRLNELLATDPETAAWRANWLFIWARALYPEDKIGRQPVRAKILCRKALGLATDETPFLDLQIEAQPAPSSEAPKLRYLTCSLLANILVDQAQTCLYQNNLTEARRLFREALNLPLKSESLGQNIQERLYTYNQRQTLKERWEEAEAALKTAVELGVSDPKIDQALDTMPTSRARLLFKADEPGEAFAILSQQHPDFSDEERRTIKTMVYQFSRLYAGRNCWTEAKRALKGLDEWLTPPDSEVKRWRDNLIREQLGFVRGRREPAPVSEAEIERLREEMRVAQEGCREAKALELTTLDTWAQDFIGAGLTLAQAYLAGDNLSDAIETYRRILEVERHGMDLQEQIRQNLHNYSERMLKKGNWDEALQAEAQVKSLNLVAPDGRTVPDPRADGAIQRTILSRAQAWLAEDQLDEMFEHIQAELPRPRPTGAVKAMVKAYSDERSGQDWPRAVASLRLLDEFLTSDHPQARDMESLEWLVDSLVQWGQHLGEDVDKLEKAAEVYREALEHTRAAAEPTSIEIASHYIRVTLELAKRSLSDDPLTADVPPAFDAAIQQYQSIVSIPEHDRDHEDQINQALREHSRKLADQEQWTRSHQVLDALDVLYPEPRGKEKQNFAMWRRDLTLKEVEIRLANQDLTPAFERLEWLKNWLDEYSAPQVTWSDSEDQVKDLVYQRFCQDWLREPDWEPAAQALASLTDLMPGDTEVTGWEVDALYQWGGWLQRAGRLGEAQALYEQALEKAHSQEMISVDQIEEGLLETQLAHAQHYLDQDEMAQATAIYQRILQRPQGYLDRADKIRKDLKDHSDGLADHPDRNWTAAHDALNRLLDLGLDNEDVSKWRQQLSLREIDVRLDDEDNLDAALGSLSAMERPWPVDDIQAIFQRYSRSRIQGDRWELALDAVRRLGDILGEDPLARAWLVKELVTLGDLLEKQENRPGAQAAFELAMKFNQL